MESISAESKENLENTKIELENRKNDVIEDSRKVLADLLDDAEKSFDLKAKELQEKMKNEFRDILNLKEDLQIKTIKPH